VRYRTIALACAAGLATMDADREIAPDRSFLVFASAGLRTKDDPKEH
jgi:hypothetical protein